MTMSDQDGPLNEYQAYEFPGHWHFYSGTALTDVRVEPLCIRIDTDTEDALDVGDAEAWRFLIALVESGNSADNGAP